MRTQKGTLIKDIKRQKYIYLMIFIPLVFYAVFKYIPLWNAQIAFRDFKSVRYGILNSPFVGLKNFKEFISSYYFWNLIKNTLMYSFGKLLVSLPSAIVLALAIYECRRPILRKTVQTLAYLPHFLSWVIMYGILLSLLAPGDGVVNDLLKTLGKKPIDFLTNSNVFPFLVIFSDAWKEMGWSAIIFIAALMGIDVSLFEAAMVEGATSWQRVRYITLPAIRPVIVIVLLLKIGTIMEAGFNQIFMLYSPAVYNVADIIDTWVYRQGLLDGRFGLATAAGLFKGVIGMLLIFITNYFSKKYTDNSLF
ncbi:ABC transporter permease [Sphaerochaeta globosa]|uniref:ABC-type transporter, integral membrane subunit n=1 Tax=Sphaerochaeta globosa (strain ATCC BAA-1886 / DSM 22777 / Buddy) TaxID=158189 RepID=F0RXQ8_SPHGB|nr:ABC transporter permease subunit [Sphaerochaeta globosa]ADY12185.1 ABC-type transporter, integral membrane subunit [Sphaerochaeta globosa str. Buddy]